MIAAAGFFIFVALMSVANALRSIAAAIRELKG